MSKKEDFIGLRISRELKASLEKKAKEKGVSLSKLIEEGLNDTYKSDKEQVSALIAQKELEKLVFWKEFYKSPIAREFKEFIPALFTEFVNPMTKDPTYHPVVLLVWINHILNETIKHFDSIPEEHRGTAAHRFIKIGETLINGLSNIKSDSEETQEQIIKLKKSFAEGACYHLTALALAKDSYNNIRAELEKVSGELLRELKEKPHVLKGAG